MFPLNAEGNALLDALLKALDSRYSEGLDHVELRGSDLIRTYISMTDSGTDTLMHRREVGHSSRVLNDGSWGFAAADGVRKPGESIAAARSAARAMSTSRRRSEVATLAPVKPVDKTVDQGKGAPLSLVDPDEKMAYLADICRSTARMEPRVVSCRCEYTEVCGTRILATNKGTTVRWDVSLVYVKASATGKSGAFLGSGREEVGYVGVSWDGLLKKQGSEQVARRLAMKIQHQMDGVSCRGGSFPCVLGPKVAGMLAHEALGHLSEADYFAAGAFNGFAGRQVAPESVTMIDSPRIRDGFGNIRVDDEGVIPRATVLIDRGILSEQMTNREWAGRLGTKPTGNARAESFRVAPIIRMRNTYFAKGDMGLDELLEGKKTGYYCGDVRGGESEANSSFQIGIQDCFEIRNGELGNPVRDAAMSGVALRALRMIDGVGSEFGIESSYCGKKGQDMETSDGGPHLGFRKGAILFGGST